MGQFAEACEVSKAPQAGSIAKKTVDSGAKAI
jgi:hypothetical protein